MPGVANLNPNYTVVTPVYQGPLDLLLQLIERAELDITRLALAQVTDQYLAHIHLITQSGEVAAEEVSAFLVIASRLVQIKSEALLPRPPVREAGEEDPGDALARQLITYKRFKELAEKLSAREAAGLHTYLRTAPLPNSETAFDLTGVSLDDLLAAARLAFGDLLQPSALSTVVAAPKITIREKIGLIADYLRRNSHGSFTDLLPEQRMRLEVVVTFLALLELVKRKLVDVQQDALFGPIAFVPSDTWDDDLAFDLEFGE
jgi:segregation and condensation protein A